MNLAMRVQKPEEPPRFRGVRMHTRIVILLMVSAALGVLGAQNPPNVKMVPVRSTSAASGQQMFNNYCSTCHGKEGRGDGPVAAALKKAPADLASLTSHNNGKFPELEVYHSIKGDGMIAAHGSQEMPVWGDVLKSLDADTDSMVRLRIANLTSYIKSLQSK
jgi:mono/diheme cytochrome c family protein